MYTPKDVVGLTSEERVNHPTHYKKHGVVHIYVDTITEEFKLINGKWELQLPF